MNTTRRRLRRSFAALLVTLLIAGSFDAVVPTTSSAADQPSDTAPAATVPTATDAPNPTSTDTPAPSMTPTPTDTPAPSDASAPSSTPAPTDTPSVTPAPSVTPTPTPTDTPSPSPSPTPTPGPIGPLSPPRLALAGPNPRLDYLASGQLALDTAAGGQLNFRTWMGSEVSGPLGDRAADLRIRVQSWGPGWIRPSFTALPGTYFAAIFSPGASYFTLTAVFIDSTDGSTVSPPAVFSVLGDGVPPWGSAMLLAGAVPAAPSTLEWIESDGTAGSGVVDRSAMLERAPLVNGACVETWTPWGDPVALGPGLVSRDPAVPWARGSISLSPLADGACWHAVVTLVDGVGHVAIVVSTEVAIAPLTPPVPPIKPGPKPKPSPWRGVTNTYRASAFETQQTWKWCTAAATEMMVSIATSRDSSSPFETQQQIMGYEQRADGLGVDSSRGATFVGWLAAVEHWGAGDYQMGSSSSYQSMLRLIATRIRLSGRPVGIAVAGGVHAWVITGFRATADPAKTSSFRVTSVFISGPLYPIQQIDGYDMPPNTELSASAFARFYRILGPDYAYAGRYAAIIPVPSSRETAAAKR